MSRQRGFSLIELLIVVALILIIAALAIPSLLRSRMSANEAATASALRTIGTANLLYLSLYRNGYAGSMAELGPPGGSCSSVGSGCADLIDALLSGVNPATPTPVKSGYRFTYYVPSLNPSPTSPNKTWAIVATPVRPDTTGHSTFCFDYNNVLWKDSSGVTTTAAATGCSPIWTAGGGIGPS